MLLAFTAGSHQSGKYTVFVSRERLCICPHSSVQPNICACENLETSLVILCYCYQSRYTIILHFHSHHRLTAKKVQRPSLYSAVVLSKLFSKTHLSHGSMVMWLFWGGERDKLYRLWTNGGVKQPHLWDCFQSVSTDENFNTPPVWLIVGGCQEGARKGGWSLNGFREGGGDKGGVGIRAEAGLYSWGYLCGLMANVLY